MKNLLKISLLALMFSSIILPQVPNAGFENWTGGEPDGWHSSNLPPQVVNVTQTTESHSGGSAVKLSVGTFLVLPWWGYIYTGGNNVANAGFPVSQRYGSLRGYYKLTSSTNKVLEITLMFKKAGEDIGGGLILLGGNVPNYSEFVVPATYSTGDIPDTAVINISYLDTADMWTAGGGAFIDDLSLSGSVDVKEIIIDQPPTSYRLVQNYPNPFNPSTKIEYSIPQESFVQLKVYNLIGQEIATLVNQYQKAGTYRVDFNAAGMQSGIYIAKLNAGAFTSSVKMTLLK